MTRCLCGKDVAGPATPVGLFVLCTRCHSLGPSIHALVVHLNRLAQWEEAWAKDPTKLHHNNADLEVFMADYIKRSLILGRAAGSMIVDQMRGPTL